jgi:hypothetical protein
VNDRDVTPATSITPSRQRNVKELKIGDRIRLSPHGVALFIVKP